MSSRDEKFNSQTGIHRDYFMSENASIIYTRTHIHLHTSACVALRKKFVKLY